MRHRFVLLGVLVSRFAFADEVDDLVAKGQELAKQNEYTQAIDAFKQADAKRPRAAHACMIGLAYMRREAWPQAELFLALCEKRAVPGDQPPDWTDEAEKQLADKLRAAKIPAITIEVTPPNVGARLTVSSFAPDEQFEPQTIHLAAGKHVIDVKAPGYLAVSRTIDVNPAEPQKISITLEPDPNDKVPTTVAPPPPHDDRSRPAVLPPPAPSKPLPVPWIVIGTGAAIGAIAVIYDAAALQPARNKLANAETPAAYDTYVDDFKSKRNITIGLAAGAALTIGVGVILQQTVYKHGPTVTAQIGDHSGALVVGWQR